MVKDFLLDVFCTRIVLYYLQKNVWNWEVYTYFACLVTRKLQSLIKFRLTITQCEDNQTYGFKLLNLSEEPLDCTISLDVCDERKNKAKNQMVLVLREENVKLENMTSYYQERDCLDENVNSPHMEVSLGLEITQDIVPTHLSMMRKFARKFNDKSTSDFVVKCQVSYIKSGAPSVTDTT